jgi:lipopolysaccharide transport system ATP-binding protein
MDTILKVEKLVKTYQNNGSSLHALNNLDLTLSKGEILGVIGNNGSGKSTLLKVLSRITKPTSGSITYQGNLTSIIDIGTGFHPDLSGKENIYLTSRLVNKTYQIKPKTYDSIVEFSGLKEFMEVPVKNYSSGMYLRLAFSIAFHSDIDILLLDEVIAVGDQNFRKKCYEKIRELKANNVGIILVSHDMESVLEFCDRCLLINKGKIVVNGEPMHVVEKYMNWNNTFQNNSKIQQSYKEIEAKKAVVYYDDPQLLEHDSFQITKLEINKDFKRTLFIEEDLEINLNINSSSDLNSFEILYFLKNINNVKIFLDSYALRTDYKPIKWKKGEHHIKCTIPKNLLNIGVYSLGIIISNNLEPIYESEQIATLKLDSKLSELKKYNKRLNFAVRPRLKWVISS